MYDVLILMTDNSIETELRSICQSDKANILVVENENAAIEKCNQEFIDLVIVWPAPPGLVQNFINRLEENDFGYVPVMAVATDSILIPELQKLPLAEVIPAGTPLALFIHMINNIMRDCDVHRFRSKSVNLQGSIEEYRLIDLIQIIQSNNNDALLTVDYFGYTGDVTFGKGTVLSATLGKKQALEALELISILPEGQFEVSFESVNLPSPPMELTIKNLLVQLLTKTTKVNDFMENFFAIGETILTNPLVKLEKPTLLQSKILKHCASPIRMMALLIEIDEAIESTIEALQSMLPDEYIGLQSIISEKVRIENARSGFDRLLGSVTAIFKRRATQDETYQYVYMGDEVKGPQLNIHPLILTPEEAQHITVKLEQQFK